MTLASISLLFPGAYSHPRQQNDQTLKLKSELVQFDILVTDKDGQPVKGLKKEDFVLSDGGKAQEVSFFSFVDVANESAPAEPANRPDSGARVLAPAPAASPIDTSSGRTIFIILDAYFIGKSSYPALNKALERLINEDLLPGDQVALISTNGALAGFQQATKNKKALLMAIDAFTGNGVGDYASLAQMDAEFAAAQQDIGMTGNSATAQYVEAKHRDSLRAVLAVAKAASNVPGRKIAFFISEDLSMRITGQFDAFDNYYSELNQIISQSRSGGTTFYTMDPRGLVVAIPGGSAAEAIGKSALSNPSPPADPGASADALLSAQRGLRDLAAGTGGYALLNSNNLHAGLQKVMSQNSSYYVLAYYPNDLPGKQQFRKVKIQVRNRPDLKVYSRTGYLWTGSAQGAQRLAAESTQELVTRALASVVPVRDVKVSIIQAAVVNDEKTHARMAKMAFSIDPNTWPFKVEGPDHIASFEVRAFCYDLNNNLLGGYSKDYTFKFNPATFSKVMQQGMNLHGDPIEIKKRGLYSLRVVVVDKDTNRLGSATEWVQAQ